MSFLSSFLTSHAKANPANETKSAYDFSFTTIDGTDFPLSELKGQIVVVVNTASECGFTKQYQDLQKLQDTYQDKNVTIIGVPSNDFGGQEPGSNAEIKKFCETSFGITFPMMEKTSVSGDDAHPFYQWARAQKVGGFLSSRPRWNFHKYVIGPNGQLVGSFGSTTNPMSKSITVLIDQFLNAQ
jgi:glutathione peroxidase